MPDDEDPAAPEPVAQGRPGHQQHREAQAVGVDRPLQRGNEACRSCRIVLSAVATTNASSATISDAVAVNTSAHDWARRVVIMHR